MNQLKYVDMLEERLLWQVSEWFRDKNFIFQQDGAPCRTGKMSMKCFQTKKLKWPGNYLDMNLIENLWEV